MGSQHVHADVAVVGSGFGVSRTRARPGFRASRSRRLATCPGGNWPYFKGEGGGR
jgi:hypothetical protein